MFVTVHAATAVIIGAQIVSAPLALILGIISHFILDIIPHGDQHLGRQFLGHRFGRFFHPKQKIRAMYVYGVIDIFFLTVFVLYLFQNFKFAYPASVSWAIIGGILPDFIMSIYLMGKVKSLSWFEKLHNTNHMLLIKRIGDIPLHIGIVMQIIIFFILYRIIQVIA